jgi:hypothetical protein
MRQQTNKVSRVQHSAALLTPAFDRSAELTILGGLSLKQCMESVQARNNGGKSGVVYSQYSVALSLTIIDGYAKVPLRAMGTDDIIGIMRVRQSVFWYHVKL